MSLDNNPDSISSAMIDGAVKGLLAIIILAAALMGVQAIQTLIFLNSL